MDGNEYIDLTMAIGPVSLGYGYPAVDDAIRAQLEKGITFTLMHPIEVEVAELLASMIPGAEMVRFSKTGCDVTSAAVRLARAFTGRSRVPFGVTADLACFSKAVANGSISRSVSGTTVTGLLTQVNAYDITGSTRSRAHRPNQTKV